MNTKNDLQTIIDWYNETSPTFCDLENELHHYDIDMGIYEFLELEGISQNEQ